MKAMPQSAKALKLVGDVHASNAGGREKVSAIVGHCKDISVGLHFNIGSEGFCL